MFVLWFVWYFHPSPYPLLVSFLRGCSPGARWDRRAAHGGIPLFAPVPFCSASPPGRITLLALEELSGLGKLHPGSCVAAGSLQVQLEVRARGEDSQRTLYGYNKLAYSQATCQENLSFLVPVVQVSCLFTRATEGGGEQRWMSFSLALCGRC